MNMGKRAILIGTVYLVHLHQPLAHAKHYLGFTEGASVDSRIALHRSGNGSRMLRAACEAGIELEVVRTWERKDRRFERKLKNRHDACALCPICAEERKARANRNARNRYALKRSLSEAA